MKLQPRLSLSFDGNCEAAFRFYEKSLDARIAFMLKWGESPASAEVPAHWQDKVYHATLLVGDTSITGGDPPPDRYEAPKGFSIVLQMDDPAGAERIFEALAQDGRVQM